MGDGIHFWEHNVFAKGREVGMQKTGSGGRSAPSLACAGDVGGCCVTQGNGAW